jgi:hypothetical protein
MVDVKQAAGRKNNCRIFIEDEKHFVPTPLSGIMVGKEKKMFSFLTVNERNENYNFTIV